MTYAFKNAGGTLGYVSVPLPVPAWSSTVAYPAFAVVSYASSVFVAIVATSGFAPNTTSDWALASATSFSPNTTPPNQTFSAVINTVVISQTLAANVDQVIFDLTDLGLTEPPVNIIPTITRTDTTKPIIAISPIQWTNTQATFDLADLTPDDTYLCSIQIFN